MLNSGTQVMTEVFKAEGLHDAMLLIPIALAITGLALVRASHHFVVDAEVMRNSMTAST